MVDDRITIMSYPSQPLSIRELRMVPQIPRETNSTGDEIKTENDHTHQERNISTTGNNHARLRNLLKVGRRRERNPNPIVTNLV